MGKMIRVDTEIDEGLNASLARLADEQGETKDALIQRALRLFVESQDRFAEAVQEGWDAWKAGEVVDHADVETAFRQRYGNQS